MTERGYWVGGRRVKADAAPIDNETKFAWEEADFEDYREWIELPADEWKERRANELRASLSGTDWYASQMAESLLEAIGADKPSTLLGVVSWLANLVEWRAKAWAKFGQMVQQRKAWREELSELEGDN